MFDDGVATVEDDVELAIGIDLDAFDHLADGIVVVHASAGTHLCDCRLQGFCFLLSPGIGFSRLSQGIQSCR